jgi:hypothetical protein
MWSALKSGSLSTQVIAACNIKISRFLRRFGDKNSGLHPQHNKLIAESRAFLGKT